MAQFIKSQTPEELWKASLKPKDPLTPADPGQPDSSGTVGAVAAPKAPGTGLILDLSA